MGYGLLGHWCPSFAHNQLQSPDISGFANHGTLVNFANNGNNAIVTSGEMKALDFDGINDYVNCGRFQSKFINAFTVSCWINLKALPATNSDQIIFGWGSDNIALNGVFLKVSNSGGTIRYIVQKNQSGVLTSTIAPVISAWWQLVFSIRGSENNLYINGVLNT